MEDKDVIMMPVVVHEATVARFERTVKRLIYALVIISIAFIFAIYMLMTAYDYTDVTVDSKDGGNANYIGASGVINNAECKSSKESSQEQEESQRH